MNRRGKSLVAALLSHTFVAGAQVTNIMIASADAFLCTGSSNYENGADLTSLNFGAAGTLVVAPPASAAGEFQSVLRFDLSTGPGLFNSAYGSNNWSITGVSLELASNYGTAGVQPNNPIFPTISGGRFVIEWLSNDSWIEGTGTPNLPTTDGVCFNSLPDLLSGPHEILCTNLYIPPGNNIPVTYPLPLNTNLLSNVLNAENVSFLFFAADDQIGYLFNSYKYGRGNEPRIEVVASPFLRILSGAFTGGVFHLTGMGNDNSVYNIQVSSNLLAPNWTTIGTTTADGAGAIHFDDAAAASQSPRFYRVSQ